MGHGKHITRGIVVDLGPQAIAKHDRLLSGKEGIHYQVEGYLGFGVAA